MIQRADITEQLSDDDIKAIRNALIGRLRHRVINRDDLESAADEAIAVGIARYDPNRVPNSRMYAAVSYLANLRIRHLLRHEYKAARLKQCESFCGDGLREPRGRSAVRVRPRPWLLQRRLPQPGRFRGPFLPPSQPLRESTIPGHE